MTEADSSNRSGGVTRLLNDFRGGDAAAAGELMAQLHGELRGLASRMNRRAAGNTWQPTALINEAYIRLSDNIYGATTVPSFGDTKRAREYYLQMLDMALRAYNQAPHDTDAKSDLIRAHFKLADVEAADIAISHLKQAQSLVETGGAAAEI